MIKINSKKAGGGFTQLDLIVTFVFILAIIFLLIYVNFGIVKSKFNIETKILGSNYPHYLINSLQSNEFDISSSCSMAPQKELSFIDLLLWLDNSCQSSDNPYIYTSCFNALNLNLNSIRDDIKKFSSIDSYIEITSDSFGPKKIQTFGSQPIYASAKRVNNEFIFSIPGKTSNIYIHSYFYDTTNIKN